MSNIVRFSLKYAIQEVRKSTPRIQEQLILKDICSFSRLFITNYNRRNLTRRIANENDDIIKRLNDDARKFGRLSITEVQRILDEIKISRSLSTSQALMMISFCGNLLSDEQPDTRIKLVQDVWKTLETLGIELDISHYNALLKIYIDNEFNFDPNDIFADVDKKKLIPNRMTYQYLITRYCQQGDIDKAFQILKMIREKDALINIGIFNALIMGHWQANDMKGAENMLNIIKQAGIQPSSETFALLICGYIKHHNLEKADELIQKCELDGIAFTDKNYLDMIHAYAISGYVDEIDKILHKIVKSESYYREACNLMFKLIAEYKLDEAFKILKSTEQCQSMDGINLPLGKSFIAHLIRCDVSMDDVLKYCKQLMIENLYPLTLNVAMENSLKYGREELALALFKVAKVNNVPVKYHYFWPLLVKRRKQNDIAGMLNVLSTMCNDFDIVLNSETVREYVIPFMLKENSNIENIITNLRNYGISVSNIIASVVIQMLTEGDLKRAAIVAENYDAHYPIYYIRKPLVSCFFSTGDVDSFVKLLWKMAVGADWFSKNSDKMKDEDHSIGSRDYREYTDQILMDIVRDMARRNDFSKLKEIIEQLCQYGVGISFRSAETIRSLLPNKYNGELSSIIRSLISDEFKTPQLPVKNSRISISALSIRSLNKYSEILSTKGESTIHIKKQLFFAYARDKNLEKLLEIKKELDAKNFVLTRGMYSYLINTFVECDRLDEAIDLYEKLQKTCLNFSLNSTKLLRLVLLLVQKIQYEKAFELLKTKPNENEEKVIEEKLHTNETICWKILDVFAENCDVQRVKKFFDVMLSNEFVEVTNILLGPLVKVHIKRNDLDSAIKEFKNCVLKYNATPWKNELCFIFIDNDDIDNLQKITDLSSLVHGESNTLQDLLFLFLEKGRIRQSQKILQIPGFRLRHDRFLTACKQYSNKGSYKHLLNLLTLTKEIPIINRRKIYYYALLVCKKANDAQLALSLWINLQEDDITPTDEFLQILAEILMKSNIPVPFTVPDNKEILAVSRESRKPRMSSSTSVLRRLIDSDNIDRALLRKNQFKLEELNEMDWSVLIECCLQKSRYTEAKNLVNECYFVTGKIPSLEIMKTFLTEAMKVPDVEVYEYFNNRLSNGLKQKLSFSNLRCRAYLNAGRMDEYLTELENSLSNVRNKEEMNIYVEMFPHEDILTAAAEKSEYVDRVENLLKLCLEKSENNITVANTLWNQYMLTKKFKDADEIWKTWKLNNTHISFRTLTNYVIRSSDVELGQKIVDSLESSKISAPALGIVYGALISAHVQNNSIEDALGTLNRALSRVQISDIIKSSLVMLKVACLSKSIKFPYEIASRRRLTVRHDVLNMDTN